MISIAICDDDDKVINQMKKYVEEYQGDKCTINTYSCGEELLSGKKKFHAIFLDIDMTGIDGIETAKRIRNYDKDVKIIYITNFTDYENLAFQVHAFGYLNKPVKKQQIYTQLNEVVEYLKDKEQEKLLKFVTLEGVILLAAKDIYYFEYVNRRVKIKTLDNSYNLKESITAMAKYMEKYGFLMPHKSFTVNLFYVKSIKGYDIFMMDGSIIPLSQKKSAEFREKFNIYLENNIKNM